MTRRRRPPGWVPNQHGAWAMLASPLAVGALAAGLSWRHVPLVAFWFAGYFAFFATSLWLKSGRRSRYLPPVRAYAALAAVLGVATLFAAPSLVGWAPGFLGPLGVGLWAAAHKHERELLSGLATVVGSALMTVVAYEAGGGPDLRRAGLLALGQFLYFGGTVCYVKSLIRERGNPRYLALSVAWHVAAAAAMVVYSPWLALVFAVLALRAAVVPRFGLSPAQIGVGEIAGTLAVALVSLATL
ncbi:MAG: YwiC-like family protein [Dermatophilaceae bacterium]